MPAEVEGVVTEYRMLILPEAAKVLGVGLRQLKEKVKSGEIRIMRWGNEKRIPAWELRRWQDEQLALRDPNREIDAKVQSILERGRQLNLNRKKKAV